MKKLIKIELVDDSVIRINYVMTGSCTYSCRYCPDYLNKGQHLPIDLDNLKKLFEKFSNRKIVLTLTGGECTTHPQFLEVLNLAKELKINVAVDTNGVRTKRFYEEHKTLVGNWNFTLHPSQHTLDLEKIKCLTDTSFVVVLISIDPDHWSTSMAWYQQVLELENVKVIPIRLISNWGGAECRINYSKEQEDFLLNNPPSLNFTEKRKQELLESHRWLMETDSIAYFNDGSNNILDPFLLIKEESNIFTGWKCSGGANAILLNPDGSVNWANCGIKKYKNYFNIDPDELRIPVTCTLNRCECGTDIRSTKIIGGQ